MTTQKNKKKKDGKPLSIRENTNGMSQGIPTGDTDRCDIGPSAQRILMEKDQIPQSIPKGEQERGDIGHSAQRISTEENGDINKTTKTTEYAVFRGDTQEEEDEDGTSGSSQGISEHESGEDEGDVEGEANTGGQISEQGDTGSVEEIRDWGGYHGRTKLEPGTIAARGRAQSERTRLEIQKQPIFTQIGRDINRYTAEGQTIYDKCKKLETRHQREMNEMKRYINRRVPEGFVANISSQLGDLQQQLKDIQEQQINMGDMIGELKQHRVANAIPGRHIGRWGARKGYGEATERARGI